jgi:hypothetical protein
MSRSLNNLPAEYALEPLEPRRVMDSEFASVGLRWEACCPWDIPATVYSTEGFIANDGTVDGNVFVAGFQSREPAGPLYYDAIDFIPDGRYTRWPDVGTLGDPKESNGAQFLASDGFPAGWWFADYGWGAEEVEFFVERPRDAILADFAGIWRFSLIGATVGTSDYYNGNGRMVIDDVDRVVDWFVEDGFVPGAGVLDRIVSVSPDGRLLTEFDEYLYISSDFSVIIFADMAEDDGEVYIGAAVRDNARPDPELLIGDYLLVWAFTNEPAGGPNGEVDYRQRYLRLESDGDYRIWNLDDYDSGFDDDDDAISWGWWSVSGDTLYLDRRDSPEQITLQLSENLSTLIGLEYYDGFFTFPILGLATYAYPGTPVEPTPPPVFTVGAVSEFGRPVVYELGTDNVWEVVDLLREAGGPSIDSQIVTWVDPKDGWAYAAGVSSSGVILYTGPEEGDWYFRNLTSEALGAEAILPGTLDVMISPDGIVTLTGLVAGGELVRYYQTGDLTATGDYRWFYQNIEARDLAPFGEMTPAFVGDLVSYATGWGGLNVAGLDASGRIWSVWWAPGLARWSVADLTAAAGAPVLASSLAVYLTPWNGINIAGLDHAGHLQVTWWVPGFGGEWRQNDLTAETGGPIFKPGSVTSYVSSWGGLNVVGIEESTGEVKAYWWSPERTRLGWAVTSLSAAVPIDSPRIVGDSLQGIAAPDSSLNVFGYAADGSFICYFWLPGFGGAWEAENLTEIAVDR